MTANRIRYSGPHSPCPVCRRTKDADCRWNLGRDGQLHLCHSGTGGLGSFPGYEFLGDTKDGRCGMYVRTEHMGAFGRGGNGSDRRSAAADAARAKARAALDEAAAEAALETLATGGSISDAQAAAWRVQHAPALGNTSTPVPVPETSAEDLERSARTVTFWLAHDARKRQLLHAHPNAQQWAARLNLPWPQAQLAFEQFEAIIVPGPGGLGDQRGEAIAFPERDGRTGQVVGYSTRYEDGTKRHSGGSRGIIVPSCLTANTRREVGPYFLVEGASDALLLHCLGFNAIARPSNTGGVGHLIEWFRRLVVEGGGEEDRREWLDIVVVGENDAKPNGLWPGRDGAVRTARRITNELLFPLPHDPSRTVGTACRIVYPPDASKDVRDWYTTQRKHSVSTARCYSEWNLHIAETATVVRPGEVPSDPSATTTGSSGGDGSSASDDDLSARAARRAAIDAALAADFPDGYVRPPSLPEPHPSSPAEEETAAAEVIRQMRADQNRFPCGHRRGIILEHRRTRDPWLVEVRCECRGRCPGCRQYLDDREVQNARLRFGQACRAAGVMIAVLTCSRADWPAMQRALRRAGGQYLRLLDAHAADAPPGGHYRVYTDAATAEMGYAPVAVLSAAAATEDLGARLALYDGDRRPISTSHAWALPREESSRQFVRVGQAQPGLSAERIIEIADAVGAIAVPTCPRDPSGKIWMMWRFVRVLADGWTDDAKSALHMGLTVGEPWAVDRPRLRAKIGGRRIGGDGATEDGILPREDTDCWAALPA